MKRFALIRAAEGTLALKLACTDSTGGGATVAVR